MNDISKREEDVLRFWEEHHIFRKSVDQRPVEKPYVFYDGPPFATGLPHYGHLIASLMKDVVPRYWTMKGYRVERVWGWDCHGLPIENIIEEKLGLKTKKDIESYGIDRFNTACRSTVLQFADEWKKTIRRYGRWVDMERAYNTMDRSYMESVWWVFSELWKKGLIYEGKKPMHICPRCATPLSNFEVTLGYKDIKDISATAKFRLTNAAEKLGLFGDVFLLAWTTTPWTLPGNVLLAVGREIDYGIFKNGQGEHIILAKNALDHYQSFAGKDYRYVKTVKGEGLVGLNYEPLFPYYTNSVRAFRVVAGDFVTTDEGTGVVHIAPAFGEDDFAIAEKECTGFIQHVTLEGTFVPEVSDFAGMPVKPKEDPTRADVEIIKYLAKHGRLFAKEKIEHSYPHCWRCDTPLLNYATSSWFVRVTELKKDLLTANKQTSWVPEHMKDGRFGKWLAGARDWAISRNRYWGTPLPMWRSQDGEVVCVGSARELEELSGHAIDDLHKDAVDAITFEKDGKLFMRIPDVLDCWFESGSMPYGQMHYPFENKEKFEQGFPAEFIAEGQDQTRGWFYTLHVLAVALTRGKQPSIPLRGPLPAFRHVIVNGIVLAQDGKKMSKKLKNYPDPMEVISRYGADAMRFYLAASPAMHAENLNFSEGGVREMYNKCVNTVWNIAQFYTMFASFPHARLDPRAFPHILDRWILSRLHNTLKKVTTHLNAYELAQSTRPLLEFISDCSQWYVRRSRERFKGEMSEDRGQALATLREVLCVLSKIIAPFTPFLAEAIHQGLRVQGSGFSKVESVHLEQWPDWDNAFIDENLERDIEDARSIVEIAHALRAEANMKVRQPLSTLVCSQPLPRAFLDMIAEEVNVREVVVKPNPKGGEGWHLRSEKNLAVALNTTLTAELEEEGVVREMIRTVNALRKKRGLTIHDMVSFCYYTDDPRLTDLIDRHREKIAKSILAESLRLKKTASMDELSVGDQKVFISLSVT
ncbi:isoleucine--tRNA ligase [Candidatus Uhrbacteria bacterium]|nr:isoleucine--tRNA ligase [Candidatus Uhrbacteria bacterium]